MDHDSKLEQDSDSPPPLFRNSVLRVGPAPAEPGVAVGVAIGRLPADTYWKEILQ